MKEDTTKMVELLNIQIINGEPKQKAEFYDQCARLHLKRHVAEKKLYIAEDSGDHLYIEKALLRQDLADKKLSRFLSLVSWHCPPIRDADVSFVGFNFCDLGHAVFYLHCLEATGHEGEEKQMCECLIGTLTNLAYVCAIQTGDPRI